MTLFPPTDTKQTEPPVPVWRALFFGGPHHEKDTLVSARCLDQPLWFEGYPQGCYRYEFQSRTAHEGYILLCFVWRKEPGAEDPPYSVRPIPRSLI